MAAAIIRLDLVDFFLWGSIKSLVYANKPTTLDDLEANIRDTFAGIMLYILKWVISGNICINDMWADIGLFNFKFPPFYSNHFVFEH